MNRRELIEKYLNYFKKKGHTIIPSASLVPENDPTVLFTTAGMHPLVPYLLGEVHPGGKRIVDNQLCLRTDDIDEVGDTSHNTFFEMLGNWSLGDYWKKESLTWSYEFLVGELGADPNKLWVTCFEGDNDAPKDEESANIWKKLGIPDERIYFFPKKDNWWGPAGHTGPCGPDSEIFYDATGVPHGSGCKPGDGCGRFFEIWNNVFMQYNKTTEGKFEPLKQKNVDTGMGVERTCAVFSGFDDNYQVDSVWGDILKKVAEVTNTTYVDNKKEHRIVADHVRASVFVISEGIFPSNKERGYILRRLIRRAARFGKKLGVHEEFLSPIAKAVISIYGQDYKQLIEKQAEIINTIKSEEKKFLVTLSKGLKEVEKIAKIDGKIAFDLYQTYGFPLELTIELFQEKGQEVDVEEFKKEFSKHQDISRTASSGTFKGGLADHSKETTSLHTATHLIHAALRRVLGNHVSQKGSNITAERLRFDFTHSEKLTLEQLKEIEDLVNQEIKRELPVSYEVKTLAEAIKEGAVAFFGERYGEKVKVYTIGDPRGEFFSKEVCGGPHVTNLKEINGRVKIYKEESASAGIRRIYARILLDTNN